MHDTDERERFEQLVLPHLGAGYNLARWLARNSHDAEDIAQEAVLRAFRAFGGYRGGSPRAWLLKIVRNTCYTWLKQNRGVEVSLESRGDGRTEWVEAPGQDSEEALVRHADTSLVREAIEGLALEFREAILLREFEGLSYKEIAEVMDVPLGTVMSRLSRARQHLQGALSKLGAKDPSRDL